MDEYDVDTSLIDQDRTMDLPYDDAAAEAMGPSLASRIQPQKVYLLEESAAALHARLGKGKRADNDEEDEDMGDAMDEDTTLRPNALFITGSPISNLTTTRIFAYVASFDVVPFGLEWVDDRSCVLLFKSRASAREALEQLARSDDADPLDGSRSARPLPPTLWPMENRIASLLGKQASGTGSDGEIRIRWAEHGDVKKKGARKQSEFYRKHGDTAGREVYRDGQIIVPPARDGPEDAQGDRDREPRRRRDADSERARLDAELDSFLQGDDDDRPSRSSQSRVPRRRSSRSVSPVRRGEQGSRGRNGRGRPRREERNARPSKTQDELDAELDAFLADRV